MNQTLDQQREHWQRNFEKRADMFGTDPSDSAIAATKAFTTEGKLDLLELGAGQGRDTMFFAKAGFRVTALDYSEAAISAIRGKASATRMHAGITGLRHDIRQPFPFPDGSFDACYSHMLFCMALTTTELERLSQEVRRVLRPSGLHVYTVRHTGDAHYQTGIHRGEDMYEVGGFIVHFFTREKVEQLATGYELLTVEEFEEGGLPRKLFRVTLRKPQ